MEKGELVVVVAVCWCYKTGHLLITRQFRNTGGSASFRKLAKLVYFVIIMSVFCSLANYCGLRLDYLGYAISAKQELRTQEADH